MPGFWLLTEGAWAEGLSHAPGWFPCCPVLSCSMCYLCFYPSTGHGDQEKCDWSRLKAVFHSSLTQLRSLFLSLSLSLSSAFPRLISLGCPSYMWSRLEEPRGRGKEPASSSRCCPSVMLLGSASRTAGTLSCTKQPEILSTESVILCLRVNTRRAKGREYLSPLCTS